MAPIVNALPVLEKFDSFADTRGLMDLSLADEDFRALELINAEKNILMRECNIFSSFLKIFSNINDEYLRIKDFKNNEIIVYSAAGHIFKPKCINIESVTIIPPTSRCYKDIQVNFTLGGETKQGFLTDDRIIKTHSAPWDCSTVPRFITLPYLKRTIVVYNNKVNIVDSKDVKYESFNFYDDISYKNYTHIDSLVNGVDIIGQMHNLTVVNENGNQWLIIADENSSQEGSSYILKNIKDWLENYLSQGFSTWVPRHPRVPRRHF